MALRSLAFRHASGASLLTLISSASRRPFSAFSCRIPAIRPLVAAVKLAPSPHRVSSGVVVRCLSVNSTTSSLNDPSPNWNNRPPKETILLDGCDFEHWLVVLDTPDPNLTRDEIIKIYIQTLAKVVGSEEEARFKIYSVSTKHYFAFGALVSEELSYQLKALPGVRWVLPDSYLDVKNKDYGGEPFINGEAVPYDPKYHEEWVRNNARAMERNRRNDRPRNFDRSRNFDRRRENMQNFQNRNVPAPIPTQELGNQPSQGPMNLGNAPGQGSVPPPMHSHDPQNSMPTPPMPGQNTQTPSAIMPNMGGPNYSGYQNQMPGQNSVPPPMASQNPLPPPPMPGQNFQPGMPPRSPPNYGQPNRDFGFQNQGPGYQHNPPPPSNQYNAGNPYQAGNPYPMGGNAYQGNQNSYQGAPPPRYQGAPPSYQGPPPPYHGNPGTHQASPNSLRGNVGGDNANQLEGGGNSGPYQEQDLSNRRYY